MFLVDTSAWIEVFRRHSRVRLQDEIPLHQVVTCLPVIQEVLQGFDDERAFRFARENLLALPIVESAMDCLIAACALRNGLTVLHCDRDFQRLARISPLQERGLKASALDTD